MKGRVARVLAHSFLYAVFVALAASAQKPEVIVETEHSDATGEANNNSGKRSDQETKSDQKPNAWFWERARQRAREAEETEADEKKTDGMTLSFRAGRIPGSLAAARKHLQEMRFLYPEDHWRVVDARIDVEMWETLSQLTIQSTERLEMAVEVTERVSKLRKREQALQYLSPTIEALQTIAAVVGTNNKIYCQGLLGLVNLYRLMGVPERAEKPLAELLEVTEGVFGKVHPNYANANSVLGEIYLSEGRLSDAEPYLRAAREVLSRTVGTNDLSYAQSCGLLGRLYFNMHDYAHAEQYLDEALQLQDRLNESKSEYAVTLSDLGNLYVVTGRWEKAEEYFHTVLKIRSQTGEKDDAVLSSLAHLYKLKGDFAKLQNDQEGQRKYHRMAEEFLERLQGLSGELFGRDSLQYSRALQQTGSHHLSTGNYKLATSELAEALEVQKNLVGEKHILYLTTLLDVAVLHYLQGEYVQAQSLAAEVVMGQADLVWDTASVQSERQQLLSINAYRGAVDFLISCALQTSKTKHQVIGDHIYDGILSAKGLVSLYQRNMRLARREPELAPLYSDLDSTTTQLANLLLAEPRSDSLLPYHRELVEKLTAKQELQEAELSRKSQALSGARRTRKLTALQLRDLLPGKSVLVDFHEIKPPPEGGYRLSEKRLVAFVIQPRQPITLLDLGPLAPIEMAFASWKSQLLGNAAPVQGLANPGRRVRNLVWQPLEDYVRGAKLVLMSPEGIICRLPFAALPGRSQNTYLIEEIEAPIVTAPIPRMLPEILRERGAVNTSVGELLSVGGVDFDADPGPTAVPADAVASSIKHAWNEYMERTAGPAPGIQANRSFQPLPGTELEIQKIGEVFHSVYPQTSIHVLKKQNATEKEFRAECPRKKYLHIATHGFFSDPDARSAATVGGSGSFPDWLLPPGSASEEDVGKTHPGLLSGLVLTGANKAQQFTGFPISLAGGILSATEVMGLDLTAADLVVLSACETGLGQVAGGEGILGLQRAFEIAGARTVIASLWSVDDRMTMELMIRFYINLWERKLTKMEALRKAQLSILNGDSEKSAIYRGLRVARFKMSDNAEGRVPPRFWAAWILSGDPN